MSRRCLLAGALVCLSLARAAGAAEDFPRPPGLEPAVQFWIRIYSEVDTRAGLIHDDRHLGVVYEQLQLPEGLSRRARERHVKRAKKRYRGILRSLSGGKRTGLSADQARVLALWPDGVSNTTLRKASQRLRFQLGQADKFRAGLVRSGAWEPHIRETFRELGLPRQLAVIPHVESSYQPTAYSHVGAAGLWQFTRATGRRFMRIDHVVDDRLDPFRATVAAARLLEQNFQTTGTWPLAITAYNHGASGMRRAVRKLGTDDIATIVEKYRSRTFGFASRNFYAEFLAAAEVDANSQHYFGALVLDAPATYEEISLPFYTTASALEKALKIDRASLRAANPSLRPLVWSGEKYLPKGHRIRVRRSQLASPLAELVTSLPDNARFTRQTRDRSVRVRRGDTLSGIARRHHTSVAALMAINNLRSRNRVRTGQVLRLPSDGSSLIAPVTTATLPKDGVYRVQRGDSISAIANRFGVSESALVRRNGLRSSNQIQVGQGIHLHGAPSVSESEPTPEASATPRSIEALEAAEVAVAEQSEESPLLGPLIADPSDYSVREDATIEVQAAETLGHVAEWLDVRASRLRSINGLRYGEPLQVASRIRLDFSRVSRSTFEERRIGHHRSIQEDFFREYEIAGTRAHVVQRGDSIWVLSQESQVPLWLLRQYNPDLDFEALHAGMKITLPKLRPHAPDQST